MGKLAELLKTTQAGLMGDNTVSFGAVGIEWLGRCDWSNNRSWGIRRHRRGFYMKLGTYGASVWNPWIQKRRAAAS